MGLTSLLEFETSSGDPVMVEVEPLAGGPVTRGGYGGEQVVKAAEALEDVFGRLRGVVERIGEELHAAAGSADELELAFGVKLSADARFVIAQAGAEANFQVTMRWTKPQP